jgi:hypothetical protein
MTVFITGDLEINGNIQYSGTYMSIDKIPHIKFVVSGNITIIPAVQRIDAELIASGSIDTCNFVGNKYPTCATPLVVNGSLQATNIRFNKVLGTLRSSTPADGQGQPAYVNAGNISEVIQFTPEVFLSRPAEQPNTSIGNQYDSLTALPPLF